MFDTHDDVTPWLNVTASFAFGALLTWLVAESTQRLRQPGPISDDIVAQHVRERIERLVSNPDDVQVTVENGVVRLAGELPPEERDELLTQLVYMPGVVRLRNALTPVS
jgi:hypothetical protein